MAGILPGTEHINMNTKQSFPLKTSVLQTDALGLGMEIGRATRAAWADGGPRFPGMSLCRSHPGLRPGCGSCPLAPPSLGFRPHGHPAAAAAPGIVSVFQFQRRGTGTEPSPRESVRLYSGRATILGDIIPHLISRNSPGLAEGKQEVSLVLLLEFQ